MLSRLILLLLLGLPVMGATLWFSDNPGMVAAEWLGWRIETNVPVLLLGVLGLLAAVEVLARIPSSLGGIAARMRAKRREKEREMGMAALLSALDAVAAGDVARARNLGDESARLLNNSGIAERVEAMAALAPEPPEPEPGAEGAAASADQPAKPAPKRRILASVGPKRAAPEAPAKKAQARPVPPPVTVEAQAQPSPQRTELLSSFADLVQERDWAKAAALLEGRTPLTAAELAARKATILYAQAMQVAAPDEAASLVRQALAASPGFVPAALLAARLHAEAGRPLDAAAVIQETWRHAPAGELDQAYQSLWPDEDAQGRLHRAEELAQRNPDHADSHLAVGAAAVAAENWGLARRHLVAAAKLRQTPQVCRLLAEVEDREPGDVHARDAWRHKAETAGLEPGWTCLDCGTAVAGWVPSCPHCGEAASVGWGVPQRVAETAEMAAVD